MSLGTKGSAGTHELGQEKYVAAENVQHEGKNKVGESKKEIKKYDDKEEVGSSEEELGVECYDSTCSFTRNDDEERVVSLFGLYQGIYILI